jgi:ATP-dependent protease HslVU (ClpYQ) peptidase subunit
MGGDSAISYGNLIAIDAMPKVFKRGEFLISSAGDSRLGDLLQYCFKIPKLAERENVNAYMASKFVPAIRKMLAAYGYPLNADDDSEAQYAGEICVGLRGKVYGIAGNFALLCPSDGVLAMGSGGEVARGVMLALKGEKPKVRIERALEISSMICDGVRAPFVVEAI